jgi:hypothetical protein
LAHPLSKQTQAFYQQQVAKKGLAGFQQVPIKLTPDVKVNSQGGQRSAVVMSWQQPQTPNKLGVATMNWTYISDPDLSNYHLSLEALSPHGIEDLGVELMDTSGRTEAWFTDQPGLAAWDKDYGIFTGNAAKQGVFDFFFADSGFDITHVIQIRFDEASLPSDPFTDPDPTGGTGAWNAWSSVYASPEPKTMAPLMLGLVAFPMIRRRMKR